MPKRLLVVDDDELNRDVISRRLIRSGYEVLTAEDGPAALHILATQPVDLVLLDFTMPGMSGLEALERIRQRFSPTLLPVIMVTAVVEGEGLVTAMRRGANDYVTKPLDFAVALARIETRLSLATANREQERANELYRLASEASDEGLWDWDLVQRTLSCSPRWKRILGCGDAEIGCDIEEWFSRVHPADQLRWRSEVDAHLHGRSVAVESEFRIRHNDGRYLWVECRGSASRNAYGAAVRLAGQMNDITARKTIDSETGLPNRFWLESELEEPAAAAARTAVLLLGLDGFDRYRENLSAEDSREVIHQVVNRLQVELRASHPEEAAALVGAGEGEIAILLRRFDAPSAVHDLAARLQRAIEYPIAGESETRFVSASAGIALSDAGLSAAGLLRDAQAALRHSREQGKGYVTVFQDALREQDLEELRLEAALRAALDRHEFLVYYQPKVELSGGSIVGFEALVRWNRPGHGIVMPNHFIPLAERVGLISAIGQFVLRRACLDASALRRLFPFVTVSVNVSGRQFSDPRLVDQVRDALEAASLPPSALRLEVTETAVMRDPAAALDAMRRLREMGVGLKLDDFGAGYSSLAYLQQFPFDTLKIDRSFVLGMENPEGLALVETIIGLARSLHLQIVAEGIENEGMAERLRRMGCRYGQGFFFSRPVDLSRLRELLAGRKLPLLSPAPAVAPEVLAYE